MRAPLVFLGTVFLGFGVADSVYAASHDSIIGAVAAGVLIAMGIQILSYEFMDWIDRRRR